LVAWRDILAKLVHEIWEVIDEQGQVLPALCLAGPDGERFRELLHQQARESDHGVPRCVDRFEADSHFEAVTIYYRRYGRGEYSSEFAWEREPYPLEWASRQSASPSTGSAS
jgi:hypothetical protein